jgi:predicted N-formylglutamate amidohydrolase
MPELKPDFTLLDHDEPCAFEVFQEGARSPFVIVCDHAGRRLPRALGSLGLSDDELRTHIAWDIGAAGVARRLAAMLDAWLIVQTYSRLVIDCNRPLSSPDSIAPRSGGVLIPGNQTLSRAEAEARVRSVFRPYHERIRTELDRRERERQPSILLSMHTFTPSLMGSVRPWHVGVLHHRDARVADVLLELLRADPELVVGDNEPYAASDLTDFSIVEHAERRSLPYVELELRQDLVVDDSGQAIWAERLAHLLESVANVA